MPRVCVTSQICLVGFVMLLAMMPRASFGESTPAAAAELVELLARGAKGAIEANFQQRKTIALLREPLESSGRVSLEPSGSFRWEVVAPEPFIVESRDGKLRVGEPGDLRLVKKGAPGLDASFPRALQSIFLADAGSLEGSFEVAASDRAGTFELIPRQGTLAPVVESMELELDPDSGVLQRVVIRQHGGDQTEIRFLP